MRSIKAIWCPREVSHLLIKVVRHPRMQANLSLCLSMVAPNHLYSVHLPRVYSLCLTYLMLTLSCTSDSCLKSGTKNKLNGQRTTTATCVVYIFRSSLSMTQRREPIAVSAETPSAVSAVPTKSSWVKSTPRRRKCVMLAVLTSRTFTSAPSTDRYLTRVRPSCNSWSTWGKRNRAPSTRLPGTTTSLGRSIAWLRAKLRVWTVTWI